MEILRSDSNGVCTLTLNRPNVFNSFNQTMAFQLHAALDACAVDDNVRVVVIKGEGKAFCAGQDLAEVIDPEGPEMKNIVGEHYNPIILKIRNLEKPVIAAVNGVAAGAGANIALACDITIAKKSAAFIQAFSKIGLIPDSGGTFFLPRLIGLQKALALMFTGEKVSAEQAEKLNMIYKAVDDETFEEEVLKFAETLAVMPTRGLGLTKKAVNLGLFNNLEDQLAVEGVLQTEAGETEDFREGVNAFLEKRAAVFKGR
ncbi:MAG: 2-(1,2-epoxy-1,2-dihydrophenyl)acetyl-CoA isomerase [Flavobacteriales bacterium]|nr:2-(1,2-epoxy-1,2-dihydrophenyl)acetyl-CoA isomerase [Crocinitomicaceae bacterium]NBX81023.1 2-(1,2-epoxy-1,2-dihydrophenyl)acetyl-CoA isomerase [Flavobacteriales bacterium]NCA21033.1 2-(1,2-epoxy-1,2-dihydrophenyl)acetyl-CoA isomerase [Crocinitomicaceae bacterium]